LRHRGAEATLYSATPTVVPALARRALRAMRRCGVDFRPGMPAGAIGAGPTVIAGSATQTFDLLLLATGAVAPPWLRASGIACDERGFALVDATLRSLSHPEIFAAGDCASVRDAPHPKSGLYSVRHGEVLDANLRSLVAGTPLLPFTPQPKALLLLSCGRKYAIAQRGGWTGEGRWAWHWKDWIDRRWIAGFQEPRG
jgi:selenide,water dikinase